MDTHPLVVKSALTADEYIAFTQLAETKGLSQSAYIRMLIKQAVAMECSQQDRALSGRLRVETGPDHP
ncbi:MAG TPA: hypothetical protein VN650_10970 [Gemmatimonadaceae bacterium]|nr:hypothetical protein [Gemmatimonadaceae bacterium]